MTHSEPRGWMKRPLVQILVAVANIQMRTLKAEVEKGFMRTAVGHELIDPKAEINLLNEKIDIAFASVVIQGLFQCRKGIRLIFLNLSVRILLRRRKRT